MKIYKLGVLMPLLVSNIDNNLPFLSTSKVYGPFDGSDNVTITMNLHGNHEGNTLFVNYYNNKTNALVGIERKNISDLLISDSTLNYTLNVKNKVNSSGLRIEMEVANVKGSGNKQTVYIYPTNKEIIYSYLYRDYPYETNGSLFYINENGEVINKESYQFKNTVDYITNDKDNILLIDEVKFDYYDLPEQVLKTPLYLRFKDTANYFPYIKATDEYKLVPLEYIQNNEEISFNFLTRMYVKTSTLQMSLTRVSGFKHTNNFYLPKQDLSVLETYDFEIYMPSFGYNSNEVHIPLQFYKDYSYAGLCSNSTYCVIGGLKE